MSVGRWSGLLAITLGIVFLVCTLAQGQSRLAQNDIANSLPETTFSADAATDRSALPLSIERTEDQRCSLWVQRVGNSVGGGRLYPLIGWLLSPLIAALTMNFSSVSVIGNALRLRTASD